MPKRNEAYLDMSISGLDSSAAESLFEDFKSVDFKEKTTLDYTNKTDASSETTKSIEPSEVSIDLGGDWA